ncbi:MAG: hypoxanthine phosphoribosyltransferase [Alphaproteobacteria bacterium]|nr:hypoxanthine phosphoribosyltransferase [Alphaproteobacteria bacterium]
MSPSPSEPTPIFRAEDIARRVEALAREIDGGEGWRARGVRPVLVCLLRGAFVFTADLVRALERAGAGADVDFLHLSSYGVSRVPERPVALIADLTSDIGGREVLILDDILDTGASLAFARAHCAARGAARVRTAVLLDKQRQSVPRADYCGFPCPDRFVVGYGMDLAGTWRGLAYIGAVD